MNNPTFTSELVPNDLEFDRMKTDLLERIEEDENHPTPHLVPVGAKRRKPRHRTAWITASGLAAAALAIALVVTNIAGPRTATAEAAEVLHNAAAASITTSDPVVGPGQFLKVQTIEMAMSTGTAPSGEEAAYEQPQKITLYVPHDKSGTWVIGRKDLKPGKTYGDAQPLIDDFWNNPHRGELHLYKAAGGDRPNGVSYNPAATLAKLPRDSKALFTYLYDHAEGSNSKNEAVFVKINDLLRTGLVPAKLRSAMYEVLARVPGVYLAKGKANLNGTTGLAISRKDPSRPFVAQIIIDPQTGRFIGERDIVTKAHGPIPAGASEDWTAVTTTVVDHAPSGPFDTMASPG